MPHEPPSDPPINPYSAPGAGRGSPDDSVLIEEFTRGTIDALRQTRPWVIFLGVLGFIGVGLMALIGLFGLLSLAAGGIRNSQALILVVYLPVALLYFFPSLFLTRYGARIGGFVRDPSHRGLEAALTTQKSFWKFVGILTLVILLLYVALIPIGVIAGLLSR